MSELELSQPIAIDLGIRPLAVRIGAQIDNIRLAGDLPDAAIAAIEAALAKYKPAKPRAKRRSRPHRLTSGNRPPSKGGHHEAST
jgi:hypothetical protein